MVASKISDQHSKDLILENMDEENGNYEEGDLVILEGSGISRDLVNKVPHRFLIKRFLEAVGVDPSKLTVDQDTPGAAFTRGMLTMYEEMNACEALAVIGFAIEQTVSGLYSYIWEGLKKSSMPADDYVFFPLHILVDDGHADLLKGAFAREWVRNPAQCANAEKIVFDVLDTRSAMFAEVRTLAEAATGNSCSKPAYKPVDAASNVTQKINPLDAISDDSFDPVRVAEAAAAVERISKGVSEHYLTHHDFLECFQENGFGNFSEATKVFATNHYTYSRNFLRFVHFNH
jgi:hypothetical protein